MLLPLRRALAAAGCHVAETDIVVANGACAPAISWCARRRRRRRPSDRRAARHRAQHDVGVSDLWEGSRPGNRDGVGARSFVHDRDLRHPYPRHTTRGSGSSDRAHRASHPHGLGVLRVMQRTPKAASREDLRNHWVVRRRAAKTFPGFRPRLFHVTVICRKREARLRSTKPVSPMSILSFTSDPIPVPQRRPAMECAYVASFAGILQVCARPGLALARPAISHEGLR